MPASAKVAATSAGFLGSGLGVGGRAGDRPTPEAVPGWRDRGTVPRGDGPVATCRSVGRHADGLLVYADAEALSVPALVLIVRVHALDFPVDHAETRDVLAGFAPPDATPPTVHETVTGWLPVEMDAEATRRSPDRAQVRPLMEGLVMAGARCAAVAAGVGSAALVVAAGAGAAAFVVLAGTVTRTTVVGCAAGSWFAGCCSAAGEASSVVGSRSAVSSGVASDGVGVGSAAVGVIWDECVGVDADVCA